MKLKKRYVAFGAAFAFLSTVGVLLYRPRFLQSLLPFTHVRNVQFTFDTADRCIALTVDDGPHADITPQVLDILKEHNVKATFFLLADHIEGNEALIRRMVAEGHEIGNHMLTDRRSIALTPYEFDRQIKLADGILRQYQTPIRWYRPGWGFYNRRMVNGATDLGYKTVLGSVYPYDANLPNQVEGVDFILRYVIDNIHPGAIVVLHDGLDERARLVDVLQKLLPQLKEQGYSFKTLTDLEIYCSGKGRPSRAR